MTMTLQLEHGLLLELTAPEMAVFAPIIEDAILVGFERMGHQILAEEETL
jgi:hypothetical protein